MKNKNVLIGLLILTLAGGSLIFATSGISIHFKNNKFTEQKNKASNNNKQTNQKSGSSLGLNWSAVGPNNFGGRTRAILIDKNNTNVIYAGGVSGGLWVSTTSGTSWTKLNDLAEDLAISCIAQGADGSIYVGTGEYFAIHKGSANGSTGFLGKGIYKSTDGTNFSLIPSTIPVNNNDTTVAWAFVNKLACDPTNQNRIFAATNKGLKRSDDGGSTWSLPVQIAGVSDTNVTTDVKVGNDGSVVISDGNKCWISPNGNNGTFICYSSDTILGYLPYSGITRVEFAISPLNTNYIYASLAGGNGNLYGIFRTTNKGASWTEIGKGGSVDFQPFTNANIPSINGILNNVIIVNPTDTNNIFLGGVNLWEWHKGGQWTLKSVFEPFNVYGIDTTRLYLHSGINNIIYNPSNSNIMYFADNGGISMSNDGGNTFQTLNIDYNTVQCNAISCSSSGTLLVGTQNNGTMFFSLSGMTPTYSQNIFDGDCGWPSFSYINPKAYFATTSYAGAQRSPDNGVTFYPNSTFFSASMLLLSTVSPGNSNYPAPFTTPQLLWESFDDTYSLDSISMTVDSVLNELLAKGTIPTSSNDSAKNFKGTLAKTGQDGASIVPGTVVIFDGTSIQSNDNGSGQFINDATGTIDYNTGSYNITFNTAPPMGTSILVSYQIKYNIGSVIHIPSENRPGVIDYVSPSTFLTGDTIKIQDVIQAKFFIGLNGSGSNGQNGIWMTNQALNYTIVPVWAQIASISGATQSMALSNDGNYMFVGSTTGNLYRLSNLRKAEDSIHSDVASPKCVIVNKHLTIASGNRAITSISVDPANANNVVVTLGGYNQSNYVYYSTNALDTSVTGPVFNLAQGNLPAMPVYSSLIPIFQSGTVIIGTENGIYTTTDITDASPQWSEDNNGMAHVPVYMIIQQQNNFWNSNCQVSNFGTIYIATHGRGVYQCQNYTSIHQLPLAGNNSSAKNYLSATMYPNPVNTNATVSFNLPVSGNVILNIYEVNGKIVNTINLSYLTKGSHLYNLDCGTIPKGTYVIQVMSGKESATAKFVKM